LLDTTVYKDLLSQMESVNQDIFALLKLKHMITIHETKAHTMQNTEWKHLLIDYPDKKDISD